MPKITTTPPRRKPRTYVLKATRGELSLLVDALDFRYGGTTATTPEAKRVRRLESSIADALERAS